MLIPRHLIQEIAPYIKRDEFLSIIGPRQSGKTVFLEILKQYILEELKVEERAVCVITFEDRKLLMEFETDPVSFIKSYIPDGHQGKTYLMIDEFQYAQDGGQKLKLIYDTIKGIKIIITGSSSLDIKAGVGKYMVGRILNFHLYPFNFGEYLTANNQRLEKAYTAHNGEIIDYLLNGRKMSLKKGQDLMHSEFVEEYEKYSIWGGYPASVLTGQEEERRKVLSAIYSNYILKDIKTLLELTTEKNLFLLSQYLAVQIGNIVVYQNLGQVSGLEYRKLKKHISILEETFICHEVKPFFKNRQKELSKNPKIYFLDMGFRNSLMENMNGLEKRSDAGAIIENTCFIRLNELCESANRINFWRTKAGAEVDFILNVADGIIPIEVKYSSLSGEKLSRGFLSFVDTFKPPRAVVMTKDFWGRAKRAKTEILFLPVYYL